MPPVPALSSVKVYAGTVEGGVPASTPLITTTVASPVATAAMGAAPILGGLTMKQIVIGAVVSLGVTAASAQLFTPNGGYKVTGAGTPGDIATIVNNANLGAAPQSFVTAQGTLDLNVSIVPGTGAPGAEWVLFRYNAQNGVLLSPSQGFWQLDETGVPAAEALNFIGSAVQFNAGGTNLAFNSSPFGNFAPSATLPAGLVGPGLLATAFKDAIGGPGPLPELGTFLNPFSQLNGRLANGALADTITGYTEALEFAPSIAPPPVPELSTWAMVISGFGLMGLMGRRRWMQRPASSSMA